MEAHVNWNWIDVIGESWLVTLARLALLAVFFGIAARLMPCNPGMYWWKDLRAVATDFIYWFIVPLLVRFCRTMMLIAGVVLLFGGKDPQPLPVRDLPLWQQCLAIQLIQDLLLYWLHRAFHTRRRHEDARRCRTGALDRFFDGREHRNSFDVGTSPLRVRSSDHLRPIGAVAQPIKPPG